MENGDQRKPKCLRAADMSLRFSTIPLSAASIWVMVTNKQLNPDYGKLSFSNIGGLSPTLQGLDLPIRASLRIYHKTPILMGGLNSLFFVIANAIVAAYALASVFNGWLGFFINDWVLFVSDQVLAYLMVSSGAAVAELLYLGYKGDEVVSWSEACTSYGRFCRHTQVSLVLHAITFICLVVLAIISAYKLFTKFEAPYISKEEEDQLD